MSAHNYVLDLIYSPFQSIHYVELRLHSGSYGTPCLGQYAIRGYFFKTVPGLLKELLK
jgi:hypothetical protein